MAAQGVLTTLCYLERDDAYLMLHRVKKKNDVNHDKWIGIGGKFEGVESPEECLLREAKEETGSRATEDRTTGDRAASLRTGRTIEASARKDLSALRLEKTKASM